MHDDVTRDLLKRLGEQDRKAVRLRLGEVTATSPLTVALGGSDVAYADVKSIATVALNDLVAVLVSDGDLLVLGTVQLERSRWSRCTTT